MASRKGKVIFSIYRFEDIFWISPVKNAALLFLICS